MNLKHINVQEKSFMANGKTYFIEAGDISVERWAKYEELSLEMQYGVTQIEMFQNWKEVTKMANELRFADIAVMANNMQNGLVNVLDRQIVGLKICALFINEEHEDRGVINDDMISQKIADWQKEGYSVGPFFQLALVFSKLTDQISNTLSRESLEKLESLKGEGISIPGSN